MNEIVTTPFWLWPVIAWVITVLSILIMGIYASRVRDGKVGTSAVVVMTLVGAIILGPIMSAAISESQEGDCVIVGDDGVVLADVSNGWVVWDGSLDEGEYLVRRREMTFATASKIEPITSNPKVRHISYEVSVRLSDRPDALEDYASKLEFPFTEGSKSFIDSTLYDFNEHRSIDLAKFYNPLRPEQQEDFEALVRNEISDELDEVGLEIVQVKFSLP